MRRAMRFVLCFVILASWTLRSEAQIDTQSTVFLQAALKAFGEGSLQDATLTGTARRIAGSTDETIPVTLAVLLSGSSQVSFQASSISLLETRTIDSVGTWTGGWIDPQGNAHAFAYHNMRTEPAWFFPVMSVTRLLANPSSVKVFYVGPDTFHSATVQHLRIVADITASTAQAQALTQADLYLDSVTLLPVGLTFNDHPNKTQLIDIPVEVRFSNYQLLDGITLPTSVQQYRNGVHCLDLEIQSVKLNTGLTITPFATK